MPFNQIPDHLKSCAVRKPPVMPLGPPRQLIVEKVIDDPVERLRQEKIKEYEIKLAVLEAKQESTKTLKLEFDKWEAMREEQLMRITECLDLTDSAMRESKVIPIEQLASLPSERDDNLQHEEVPQLVFEKQPPKVEVKEEVVVIDHKPIALSKKKKEKKQEKKQGKKLKKQVKQVQKTKQQVQASGVQKPVALPPQRWR